MTITDRGNWRSFQNSLLGGGGVGTRSPRESCPGEPSLLSVGDVNYRQRQLEEWEGGPKGAWPEIAEEDMGTAGREDTTR